MCVSLLAAVAIIIAMKFRCIYVNTYIHIRRLDFAYTLIHMHVAIAIIIQQYN